MNDRVLGSTQAISLLSLGLAATLIACGDAGGTSTGAGGGDATTGDSSTAGTGGEQTVASSATGASAGGGSADECPVPDGFSSPAAMRAIELVEGAATTPDGDSPGEVEIQMCGKNLCLYAATGEDGLYVIANPGATPLDTPIVKVGDGLQQTKFGFGIPDPVAPVDVLVAPMDDSGTALTAGAEAEADGAALAVDPDGVVVLNILDFADPGEDTFRAAIMREDALEVLAPGEGFVAVLYLGPRDTRFCPPASLSIPNEAGLDAGAAVEFLLYGLDVGEPFAAYAEWTTIADGQVSEDGATIATLDGEGIPVLGAIGVRPVD